MAQLDWLGQAQQAVNADPGFRRLGSTDLLLGLKAGTTVRVVTFEAFEVTAVDAVDETALGDCELVIEMTPRQWNDYLKRRARGTGRPLMDLDLDRAIVSAPDPLRRLKFERYHLSVQALLDAGARVLAAAG